MVPSRGLTSFTLLFTLIASSFAADCYNPDGSNRNQDPDVPEGYIYYEPCTQLNKFSMCCRSPNNGGDTCLPNGLCQGYASDGSKPIWRESCTDPTWNSPFCLKGLCDSGDDEKGYNRATGDNQVFQCPDESWCCGGTNSTCCSRGDGKWIVNGRVTDINPASASASTSSPSTSSSSTGPTTTPTTANQQALPSPVSKSNNAGAIAGGVVGGVAAICILVGAIWFFRRRMNRKQPQPEVQEQQSSPMSPAPDYEPGNGAGPRSIRGLHEADTPVDRKHLLPLDSTERYEIGYQDKDENKVTRQELPS